MVEIISQFIKDNNIISVIIVAFIGAIIYRIATKDDPVSFLKKIFTKNRNVPTITREQVDNLAAFINSSKNLEKTLDEILGLLKKMAIIVDNGVAIINEDLAYRIFKNAIRDSQSNILDLCSDIIKSNNIAKNEIEYRKRMEEKIDSFLIDLRSDLDSFIVMNKNDNKIFKLSEWIEKNKDCVKTIGSQCIDRIKDGDLFDDIKVFVFLRIDSFSENLKKDVNEFGSPTHQSRKSIKQSN